MTLEEKIHRMEEAKEMLCAMHSFPQDRIAVYINSYEEWTIEIDDEVWENCYSFEEADGILAGFFKGYELGKIDMINKLKPI